MDAARARGVRIEGPFPGDTVFVRAARGDFDAVIACYHDQGLIPVKLLAFGKAVEERDKTERSVGEAGEQVASSCRCDVGTAVAPQVPHVHGSRPAGGRRAVAPDRIPG